MPRLEAPARTQAEPLAIPQLPVAAVPPNAFGADAEAAVFHFVMISGFLLLSCRFVRGDCQMPAASTDPGSARLTADHRDGLCIRVQHYIQLRLQCNMLRQERASGLRYDDDQDGDGAGSLQTRMIDASAVRAHRHAAGSLREGETPQPGRSRGGSSAGMHAVVGGQRPAEGLGTDARSGRRPNRRTSARGCLVMAKSRMDRLWNMA